MGIISEIFRYLMKECDKAAQKGMKSSNPEYRDKAIEYYKKKEEMEQIRRERGY